MRSSLPLSSSPSIAIALHIAAPGSVSCHVLGLTTVYIGDILALQM